MKKSYNSIHSVQSLSCVWLFEALWTATHQSYLSIINYQSLLKQMSNVSVIRSNYLILCRPLLLPPSIFPSIRVFSNESLLIRWPKYCSFSFNISPSNEHSGLITFRMDWSDLLAVQGTLKSLLQHHSSKASILRCSAFFTIFQNSQVQFTYLVNLRCFHISKIKALHTSTMYLYSLNLKLKSSHLLWN